MKTEAKPRSDAAISCACSAPAPVRRQLPPRWSARPRRRPRTTMRSARPRYKADSADVKTYLPRQPLSELREAPVLIKKAERQARRGSLAALATQGSAGVDRRAFLRRSGLAAGGLAALGALPLASVRKAEAAAAGRSPPARPSARASARIARSAAPSPRKSSTASGSARSRAGISPINRGSHCAKGASVRELVSGERRLKYPMKLVDGQWTRIKWDQAIDEIGDKLAAIREKSGGDSVYWLGSAKMTNEGSYLFRKLGAFWGTNNTDHQARICHSTTVTGVANTWGYGAMTNSYNDIRNAKTHDHHGRQSGGSASGVAAALLEGDGAQQGEFHRHRSAPDAHRRACDRICPHASRHRHSGAVRDDVAHPQERLGRQGIHQAARLRLRRRCARKSRSGRRRKSSASPACRASSSSASPRCSRRRSRRR